MIEWCRKTSYNCISFIGVGTVGVGVGWAFLAKKDITITKTFVYFIFFLLFSQSPLPTFNLLTTPLSFNSFHILMIIKRKNKMIFVLNSSPLIHRYHRCRPFQNENKNEFSIPPDPTHHIDWNFETLDGHFSEHWNGRQYPHFSSYRKQSENNYSLFRYNTIEFFDFALNFINIRN